MRIIERGRRGKKSDTDPGPRVCGGSPFSQSRTATQMSLKITALLIL